MSELAVRLKDVVAATDAYRQTAARLLGLGVPEATILVHLLHEGPRTPSALARRVGVSPASATAQLDRLELAGNVVRRGNPRDRRSILVDLTDRGRELGSRLFAAYSAEIDDGTADVDPATVAEMAVVLDHLTRRLEDKAADEPALAAELEELRGDRSTFP
ncbi:MarR family transcriptional regulator [Pseudonocardia ailaonensis]|uniref:MarR family transcriptional regulator n=1 Tax=Pseudonocardia ailaonensis TaxID=367279 RepID=A0ABN2MUL9_9PSEU